MINASENLNYSHTGSARTVTSEADAPALFVDDRNNTD